MLEARTSIRAGSPPITQTTFRTCRAHYPGGSEQVHLSVPSLPHAAFPILRAGRHPRFHFRGLLELHSCYGLPVARPPNVGFVTRLRSDRLPSQIARQLPCQPITTWVAPSSTGDLRRWGAPQDSG